MKRDASHEHLLSHYPPLYNADMNSLLSADRIASLVLPMSPHIAIEIVNETGSTNADLLARAEQLSDPVLRVAETQTAGRGRAGRVWHAEPTASLTFSLAWPFQCGVSALLGLPLVVGVALAETLAAQGVDARLKWPNDLLLHDEKLGGILVETATARQDGDVLTWAVIGVGLNLAMPQTLQQKIGGTAAALPVGANRNQLLAVLAQGLATVLPQFAREGFAPFAARWNLLHAHAGQAVRIIDHGQILHVGVAVGVDATGRLLLDTDAGRVAVMAGDVSLRRQEGQHAIAG